MVRPPQLVPVNMPETSILTVPFGVSIAADMSARDPIRECAASLRRDELNLGVAEFGPQGFEQ